ncbi:hypothetical protein DIR46_02380 [Massilia oculi]|uniref:Uncharacterized protein n=2 Tax=Massilia oculi TaxID=945844 RepID=A0A2S2DDI4_9BURK|nr:hypothetical protein [Massilia oculi]AWL03412.1 hypothetical protein DIR46_02380 [Massilia oculi]
MRALQIKNAESDLAAQEAQRERAQNLLKLTSQYGQSRGAGQPKSAPPADRSANAMFQSLMPGAAPSMTTPGAPMAAASMTAPGGAGGRSALVQERLQYAQFLRDNGYAAEANAAENQALKLQPKVKEWQKVNVGDQTLYAPYFEDGSSGQPVPLEVAQNLERVNLGGTTELIHPTTGKSVRSMANTVTPGDLLSAQVQRENSLRQDTRARELNALTREGQQTQIINDPLRGPLLIDKATGVARPATMNGQALPGEAAVKREAAAKNLMPLIKQAGKLIDGATGSYLGAAIDQGARYYGSSTDGAKNIAQLRVLEGNIMMAQPRMEGPQSNLDVELYRQMAAQIGDPTVPNDTKKAALKTLESMYEKYGSKPPADIPRDAINHLKLNPKLRDAFDAKYGAGSAASVLGR